MDHKERIAVVGLGYVGLPVAVALAEKWPDSVGFDISRPRVESLQGGIDWTGEIESERLVASGLKVTADPHAMKGCTVFIVTVPTPIDSKNQPDLSPLHGACEVVGAQMAKGAVVVFESTVYPGVTENFCAPLLEQYSGLKHGPDFKLGYSPERINPGDPNNRFESINKIVAGEDEATLARLLAVYGSVVQAELYPTTTIKVAEAAKVLENTQRDLNIALMNELALILDRMNISTREVLEAAGTKWNFLKFSPGLVGGHCIGVDPYYLTAVAQEMGYRPEVILAGRRVNDGMGAFIAQKIVKLMSQKDFDLTKAKVCVFGATFKENVPDIRNAKVYDIIDELRAFSVEAMLTDPIASAEAVRHEYGMTLADERDTRDLDVLVLAVPHSHYTTDYDSLLQRLKPDGLLVDVKAAVPKSQLRNDLTYWAL
ncbi:MAG: nucleotide sugar dehydrogenase [Alphaproteobacteria bacterium]|nr:nucleotide sugar dehydrogenase [Alphaproteobacteria bacterium]MDE2340848.1 nucleotide sugar dehydrogenase [Alphaproteobacteria bacterium]